MEGSENLLKAIYEDDSLEDYQDADLLDSETLEEGECRIQIGSLQLTETSKSEEGECTGKIGDLGLTEMGSRGDVTVNQASNTNKKKKNKNKKKNKSKKTGPAPAIKNMNKFVIGTCKRLKERKTYLVWNAAGVLGVSALSDIVNEFLKERYWRVREDILLKYSYSLAGFYTDPRNEWFQTWWMQFRHVEDR